MVFRLLFRYLMNNERIISRLSESYPMRRAAQMLVYLFNRSQAITENSKLTEKLSSQNISERLKSIRDNLEKKKNS